MPESGPVLAIAANNVRRIVRAPVMLFTTLLLPFMIIAVVGVALGGSQGKLQTGLVSHDPAEAAVTLSTALHGSSALRIFTYGSDAALERAVRRGEVSAGIVVPASYSAQVAAGSTTTVRFVTTPSQTRAASIRTVLQAIVDESSGPVQASRFSAQHTGRAVAAELRRVSGVQAAISSPTVLTDAIGKSSTDTLGFQYTAPANLVLFIVITSLTSAATLIDTRARGITTRMFSMPVRRGSILAGELLGRLVIAGLQAGVILAISSVAFGVSWGSAIGVAVLTLALCIFGAALGMLIGFAARSMSQAVSFGPPLGVVLGMLGGCMWPLAVVGPVVREIGHISPNAWAMDGYLSLMNRNATLGGVLPQVGVLLAYAVTLLSLTTLLIRRRRTA